MSREDDLNQSRFLLSSAVTTFAVGAFVALNRVSKKKTFLPFFRSNGGHDPTFSPVLHAAKALGVGTLLCVGSATAIVGAGSYLLDVHDLPSFAQKMRSFMRHAGLSKRLESHSNHDADATKEWEQLWQEARLIDEERAQAKQIKKMAKKTAMVEKNSIP